MAKRDSDFEFSMYAAFDEDRTTVDKVPLYLINGSLGAGKTTVLEYLLRQPEFHNARVIENEFANENIDGYRLEKLTNTVTTLAGDCICCVTGDDALIRLLDDFTRDSGRPVLIEATGVARTMNLIDRLVKSGMLARYELMQSVYVIGAAELLAPIDASKQVELQLADAILVTKYNALNDDDRQRFDDAMSTLPYERIITVDHGEFALDRLEMPSGALTFFDSYDGTLNVPDNPTYSVIDVSHDVIDGAVWDDLWPQLTDGYGLRRLKGGFVDANGRRQHVEATPELLTVSAGRSDEPVKLVFIGERADELTREVLLAQLMMMS